METKNERPVPTGAAIAAVAIEARLRADLQEAEDKAWDALARYKFQMFGYWAAIWVHLNRVGGFKLPNPFKTTVLLARNKIGAREKVDERPLPRSGETSLSRNLKRLVKAHDDALKPVQHWAK